MKKIVIILVFVIVIITFIFCQNNEDKTFKINGTTYALSIDGEDVKEIPSSGYYYLTSYSCENGSIITWDYKSHDLYIKGTNSNKDSCMLDFSTKLYLNTMKVGDYVAYLGNNGCLNGASGTTGTSTAEAGNSCKGENANQSIDTNGTYGYCYNANYRFYVYGWRIAYIENDNVYLTSAGAPECRNVGGSGSATQNADLNNAALKYCNKTYADGGICSSSNTWAMGNEDFKKITYAISGTSSNLISAYGSPHCMEVSSKTCGYLNDLINNGGFYSFADSASWSPSSKYITWSKTGAGFRPVIRLSSSVYVTGGSGTMEEPYEIGI